MSCELGFFFFTYTDVSHTVGAAFMKLKRFARNIVLLQTDNSTHSIFIMQQEVFSNKVTLPDIDTLISSISVALETELLDATVTTSGVLISTYTVKMFFF